uniref:Uncharacterized protein n=1 Tax=Romanomermis culicivorax TaxID=13658 RepID=A0A915L5C4_ROMCU
MLDHWTKSLTSRRLSASMDKRQGMRTKFFNGMRQLSSGKKRIRLDITLESEIQGAELEISLCEVEKSLPCELYSSSGST